MPSTQNAPDNAWNRKLAFTVTVILGLFIGVGMFSLWFTNEGPGIVLTWFWVGVGVSVIYLLYKIAQEIHRLEAGQ